MDEIVRGLEREEEGRRLLIVDDLHCLDGTRAAGAFEKLIEYAPPHLSILAASRTTPHLNLARLRVSERLIEIGPDDLRFRSWEVERLFRELYGESFPPEDLAALTRRTQGWAAGLQLFHLATEGKPIPERRRLLGSIATRSRLVREYLATNVVNALPSDLRSFLLNTSLLGKLSGSLCDAFLGRSGSGRVLEELERRQLFTSAIDDGWFRYHEVLRSHLIATLVDELGEDEVRRGFRRAGSLLEEFDGAQEAIHAYCLADEVSSIARLLGCEGELLAENAGGWVESLPYPLVSTDPWLLLATARHHRSAGRWKQAVETYRQAEAAFASEAAAERARSERLAVTAWLEPTPQQTPGWSGVVRAATARKPLASLKGVRGERDSDGELARGLSALLGGSLTDARTALTAVELNPEASPAASIAARLARAVAELLGGDPAGTASAESAAEAAETAGLPWLARIARATLAASDRADGCSEAAAARLAFERESDAWGVALTSLLEGWGSIRSAAPRSAVLEAAASAFRNLGAGVLEAWALSMHSLAEARVASPTATTSADRALSLARRLEVPGAESIALQALAESVPKSGGSWSEDAAALVATCGLNIPSGARLEEDEAPPTIDVRCLGGFRIAVDGQDVDLGGVKPRVRAALRFLVLHEGQPVHREVLLSALWPELDTARGSRCLHVALSALRHIFDLASPLHRCEILRREGEAYVLALPSGSVIDAGELERAVLHGGEARAQGDRLRSIAAYRQAIALYGGDLFPEDGPAEWVISERDRVRALAVDASIAMAELLVAEGQPADAAEVCAWGLRIDRYRDELWTLRINSLRAAGCRAAAAHARQDYKLVLDELDLESV